MGSFCKRHQKIRWKGCHATHSHAWPARMTDKASEFVSETFNHGWQERRKNAAGRHLQSVPALLSELFCWGWDGREGGYSKSKGKKWRGRNSKVRYGMYNLQR